MNKAGFKESQTNNPEVSIIIPVYNVEEYLTKCLNSLRTQTLYNIEIIVVDDGSTDQSSIICNYFAKVDSRFKVIHQNNQGLSIARNVGMCAAKAKYIMFVDSDDWVEPNFCKLPYELAREEDSDFLIFEFRVYNNKSFQRKNFLRDTIGVLSREQCMHFITEKGSVVVWNKMFKRDLINGIEFIPNRYFEDNFFTPEVVHKANKILYIPALLYNHRKRNGSIMTLRTEQAEKDFYEMHRIAVNRINEWGYPDVAQRYHLKMLWQYRKIFGRNAIYAKECTKYLFKHADKIDFFKWRGKIMFVVLKISPWLFDIINTVFKR